MKRHRKYELKQLRINKQTKFCLDIDRDETVKRKLDMKYYVNRNTNITPSGVAKYFFYLVGAHPFYP